jgi:hypothetical protein
MNPEEFRAKCPLILNWIRQILAQHAATDRICFSRTRL